MVGEFFNVLGWIREIYFLNFIDVGHRTRNWERKCPWSFHSTQIIAYSLSSFDVTMT